MNVCENTRGWPSTAFRGVFAGFPVGPWPWRTVPETVMSRLGGWLPVRVRRVSEGSNLREKQRRDGTRLGWGGNRMTALRVWSQECR